jgi:hypothetical protein
VPILRKQRIDMIQLPEKYGKENFDVSSKALGREEGRLIVP